MIAIVMAQSMRAVCICSKGGFMFIETYYNDRAAVPGNISETGIPYPELAGEELTVWRKYLPFNRQVESLHYSFNGAPVPDIVSAEVERAKKAPHLFDHIEIWSRTDDPMAVGVITGAKPRYFSIVRWGDAELTLAQVKRKLRAEKWILSLTWIAGISVSLAAAIYIVLQ
jgi:hypothetical protein